MYTVPSNYTSKQDWNMCVNKSDKEYLTKLYKLLEQTKQKQLGLDNESRVEYRKLEKAIISKIKEFEVSLRKSSKETMV